MKIGDKEFVIGERPYIIGILNMTPDSFSDGGLNSTVDKSLRHVEQMIDEGADIIDVGGESTRPGHIQISDEEEIERTARIIEKIKKNFDITVSLDTYKSSVAIAGLKAGADLINDIWGFKYDDKMAKTVADYNAACCLMHNKDNNVYNNFVKDVVKEVEESIKIALEAGVDKDKIMTDPGIGFGKDTEQNLIMMNNLDKLVELGYPVLLGTSRKSMIGNTLKLPVDEREEGTIATSCLGLCRGCSFFRVHDVKKNYRALTMTQAMITQKRV